MSSALLSCQDFSKCSWTIHISKGYRLKYSSGLLKDGAVVAGQTEESVLSALSLPCPFPQLREIVDGKPAWEKT